MSERPDSNTYFCPSCYSNCPDDGGDCPNCGSTSRVHRDAYARMKARAVRAEARIAHIRSLLGYPRCTPCIMADEDCEECPVAGKDEES